MNIMKKWRSFWTLKPKANGGFTLVELIVVIAILGILAGVGTVGYSGYVKKAERAGDEQLLATINKAFAAACTVNGSDIYLVNGAYVGLTEDKAVDLDKVEPEGYAEAFAQFYAGNEDSAFKVFPGIYFNLSQHKFVEGSAAYMNALNEILNDPEMQGKINAVQLSKYAAIGATALMNAVDGVTGLAEEMLGNDESALYKMIFSDDSTYLENLATILGFSDGTELDEFLATVENPEQFLANSTVLSVATTVNSESYNRSALTEKLVSGKLSEVVSAVTTSENGLAEAALIYGLYTAYAPEKAADINGTAGLAALAEDTDGFMAYLATLNEPGSQASEDLAGYYAALDIVNNAVSGNPKVGKQVLENGYNDEELVGIVGSIIGS